MVAVILSGGQSRRMGTPKAWVDIGGRPCIGRVLDACRAAPLGVEFQGTLAGLAEAFPGVPVWPDADPGQGPLAALAAAFARRPGRSVFLLACDLPFVSPDLLRGVAAALDGADWAVPAHGGQLHPLCAAYAPSALPLVAALLGQGRRDMHALLRHPALSGRRVEPTPAWGAPDTLLMNVNTPEDLAAARRLAGG